MAPTVLTLDERNPSSVYADLVFTEAEGDQYLDPKKTPSFHSKNAGVEPGETRDYYTITEVPDALSACVFALGPSLDPEYPRVTVHLPE